MRIGIDFDNTIICYDDVFCDLAKAQHLVDDDYQGGKRALRDTVRALPEGDLIWQRIQGKAYGEWIKKAKMFNGFKEFIAMCNQHEVEVFIVSHKTELGHFDEKRINLRTAAKEWLVDQGLFQGHVPYLYENNVFFEFTRDEKIERIKSLQCTHFIDDLIEIFDSPLFPSQIKRFLFQPDHSSIDRPGIDKTPPSYSNWTEITNAFFPH